MMRNILFVLLSLLVPFSVASGGSFNDFMKENEQEFVEENGGFDDYRAEMEKEFEAYRAIVGEEFASYKKEIGRLWRSAEVSDKKRWVEYSPDFRTKRVVDFEEGSITIEFIDGRKSDPDLERRFGEILKDMILEDRKSAFDRDRVAKRVEERISKGSKNIKRGKVEKEPILAPIILGKPNPTRKEAGDRATALVKKGKVERRPSAVKGREVVSLKVPFPPKSMMRKARFYKPVVKKYADRYDLESALVFAVIHTESAFNPMATSYVPAYGLMQIVPKSAGADVTKFLHGRSVILAPSYLYNHENNIQIGTAYLHMLSYKYFKDIKDPQSRLYCAISAYNTGPGNVAKTFTGGRNVNKAVPIINRMSPSEVYRKLRKDLPYVETRDYLERVSGRMPAYGTI